MFKNKKYTSIEGIYIERKKNQLIRIINHIHGLQQNHGLSKQSMSRNQIAANVNTASLSSNGNSTWYLSAVEQHSLKHPLCSFLAQPHLCPNLSTTSKFNSLPILPQHYVEQHQCMFKVHALIFLNKFPSLISRPL